MLLVHLAISLSRHSQSSKSEQFHARLKQGEQFQIFEAQKPLEKGESRIHFGLSNLIVPGFATMHLKKFQIVLFR